VKIVYSSIIEDLLVPFYDIVRKTSRSKCRRVLEKTQYLSRQEIECLQTYNLRLLIEHAYKSVPYYHKVFKERGLKPDDIKTVRDLEKLPVLTKATIRQNFVDLISREVSRNELISYSTGGTGSPLRFYITKEKISWEVAAEYRAYAWAGYRLGDRCFMFWGARRDLNLPKFSFTYYAREFAGMLQRTMVVDPFVLSEEALTGFVAALRKFKPQVIRGYAVPVYMTAKFLVEKGIDAIRPRTVITSAEMLFDPMRKTIQKAFGCPVFDYYGSREIGAIASECEMHSGHHISAENVVVEFAENGKHVEPGQSGVLLLTGLRNYGMPFIRYEIGDVGEPSDETCSCGRGLPLMKAIKGYESQFLGVRDKSSGRIIPISSHIDFFIDLLKSPPPNYRIIQESLSHVVIKIVAKGKNYSDEDVDLLVRELRDCLGNDVEIEVQFVDTLPPLPSGKRSPVISKVNPFQDEFSK
jgi:phenylacetate-CoA ligase